MLNIVLSILAGLLSGTIYGLLLLRFSLNPKGKSPILLRHLFWQTFIGFFRIVIVGILFYTVIKYSSLNFISFSISFLLAFIIYINIMLKKSIK